MEYSFLEIGMFGHNYCSFFEIQGDLGDPGRQGTPGDQGFVGIPGIYKDGDGIGSIGNPGFQVENEHCDYRY